MKTFFFLFLSLQVCFAADSDSRTLTVNGHCIKKVSPDRGSVTLVAQYTEKSAKLASQKAMATYEKIRQAVQKMGLKDLELQTSEYTVQEQIEYINNRSEVKGIRASLGLQVITSEIPKLGDVMALGQQFEINRVADLRTFLSAEKSKTTRENCLVEAIKNARDKADKMAESAKAQVGLVRMIDEDPNRGTHQQQNFMMESVQSDMASPSRSASLSPGIESKPELISVEVLVKYELK